MTGFTGTLNARLQAVRVHENYDGVYAISNSGKRAKQHFMSVLNPQIAKRLEQEPVQALIQFNVKFGSHVYTDKNGNTHTQIDQVITGFRNLEPRSIRENRAKNKSAVVTK